LAFIVSVEGVIDNSARPGVGVGVGVIVGVGVVVGVGVGLTPVVGIGVGVKVGVGDGVGVTVGVETGLISARYIFPGVVWYGLLDSGIPLPAAPVTKALLEESSAIA
jgi:hypothetical protein